MKLIFVAVLVAYVSVVQAFPIASDERKAEFESLVNECVAFQRQPRVLASSMSYLHHEFPGFQKLIETSGLESIGLIYEVFKKAKGRSPHDYRPLNDLWGELTWCGSIYEIPWNPRGVVDMWECGAEYYDEQISFLLKEMRLAAKEGRREDERVCKQLISCEGIFSFPKLFAELEAGHEDVIDILALVWRNPDRRPAKMDKKSLLAWWAANRENYALPKQAPGFKKTKDIHHWKRSGK